MLPKKVEVEKAQVTAVLPNFIVGGTLKAGTSSVYRYLYEHPQVCGSSVKETHFFERDFNGDPEIDIETYSKFFEHYEAQNKVVMEATPAYIAYADQVAPRMKGMLPNVKLLFILRDPADRLYSYYNFHIGRLTKDFFVPDGKKGIGFEEYLNRCTKYLNDSSQVSDLNMEEWFLRALEIGRYSEYLKKYYDTFERGDIKVMFFEDLKSDARSFMVELCGFLDIDPGFYDDYTFNKVNATFESRVKSLHQIATTVNEVCDGILQSVPALRKTVVAGYRYINKKEGYEPMNSDARVKLNEIFAPSNKELVELLDIGKLPGWLK